MDAPRTPLIRVRKGNTLLLNSTHLRYEHPHQNRLLIRKSYGGRIDLQTTIRLESERLLLRSKPCALSRVFLLSSGGKSVLLMKKKAPSRSRILLSMYVVLKTRYVNPDIHIRRHYSHVRSPNLSATRPQLLSLRTATT